MMRHNFVSYNLIVTHARFFTVCNLQSSYSLHRFLKVLLMKSSLIVTVNGFLKNYYLQFSIEIPTECRIQFHQCPFRIVHKYVLVTRFPFSREKNQFPLDATSFANQALTLPSNPNVEGYNRFTPANLKLLSHLHICG